MVAHSSFVPPFQRNQMIWQSIVVMVAHKKFVNRGHDCLWALLPVGNLRIVVNIHIDAFFQGEVKKARVYTYNRLHLTKGLILVINLTNIASSLSEIFYIMATILMEFYFTQMSRNLKNFQYEQDSNQSSTDYTTDTLVSIAIGIDNVGSRIISITAKKKFGKAEIGALNFCFTKSDICTPN